MQTSAPCLGRICSYYNKAKYDKVDLLEVLSRFFNFEIKTSYLACFVSEPTIMRF